MATKRLTNLDGNLASATVGSEIVGDGSTANPADGTYLVTSVASSGSALPAGIEAGYLCQLTTSDTPAIGDDVKPVTLTNMCFVQGASMEFSRDELEVTTLCDTVKTYKAGFTDVSGSFDGITDAGNTDLLAIIGRFIDTVQLSADGSTATITDANTDMFYLQLEVNKETSSANEPVEYYFVPVTFISTSAGVTQGSAQTFTAGFRVTSDGTNGVKPAFYTQAVA